MIAGLLLAAAVGAPAPLPPVPPAAPAAPAAFAPPALPAPVSLDMDSWGGGGGRRTVVSREVDGHRVTVVARAPGATPSPVVQSYRDAQGRDVQVYSDRPVSREEADGLLAEAGAQGERAREQGRLAREAGERAREQGRAARETGERARRAGERLREEALESARRAVAEAGLSSRDYADLGQLRTLRIYRDDGGPSVDGARPGPAFAEGPQVRALRDEVRALREELKAMRAELDREHGRR